VSLPLPVTARRRSLDDIEEIQGYIAAEANHTKKKLQKEFDRIFDKLQVYLDTYDDHDE